jgi:hypothetical protein
MAEDNNRGVSTPPVGGTPTPGQAPSEVVSIDCYQYGKQYVPKGYARTSPEPQMDNPLGDTAGEGPKKLVPSSPGRGGNP